jgi:FAD/FMN-containing dehydrogenase
VLNFHNRPDRAAWGRLTRPVQRVATPRSLQDIQRWAEHSPEPRLAVGLRRSYGDVCLSASGAVIEMGGRDRLIDFDAASGWLTAEAGISLDAILRFAVPRGFFLPVTPGTRFVTLGGAIANDVHGKNHHRAGTFGCHVGAIALLRSDRGLVEVSPDREADLHAATIGGLGLTGIMTRAAIRLVPIRSAWLDAETLPFQGIGQFLDLAHGSEESHEFTVAWLECSGRSAARFRGLFHRANWSCQGDLAPHREPRLSVPLDAPGAAVNALTVGALNVAYRGRNRRPRRYRQHYGPFFYPLDGIGSWNRLYGPRGFHQYQFAVPFSAAAEALAECMRLVARSGQGSFLSVLKTFGALPSPGLMSFPRPGVTLALDFPNRGDATSRLLDDLDRVVSAAGGRLYPAKDARMPAAMLRQGYPGWERFLGLLDPAMRSDFLDRMQA